MRVLFVVILLSEVCYGQYQVTEVGQAVYGISDTGQATGVTTFATDSTLADTFTWTRFGGTQGTGLNQTANAINSSGIVVGQHTFGDSTHAASWSPATGVVDLGSLDPSPYSISTANGINDLGQIAGTANTPSTWQHAFIWTNGVMTDIAPDVVPDRYSQGRGLNNIGTVVGRGEPTAGALGRAFEWTQATGMQYLPGVGGNDSIAFSVNDSNQVAGFASDATGTPHAVIWQNGIAHDLGYWSGTSHHLSAGLSAAISDTGEAVFTWRDAGFEQTATALFDANTLSSPGFITPSFQPSLDWIDTGDMLVASAPQINSSGQIVGTAIDPDGSQHGFILSQVPEPSTFVLALIGFILLWSRRYV